MAGESAGRSKGSGEGTYELEEWVVGPQTDWVVALGLLLSAKWDYVHVPGVVVGGDIAGLVMLLLVLYGAWLCRLVGRWAAADVLP